MSLRRCWCGWWSELVADEDPCPECGSTSPAEVATISDETMGRVRVVVDVVHPVNGPPVIYIRVLDSVESLHLRVERVQARGDRPTVEELGRVAHLVHAVLAALLSQEITRRTPAADAALALRPLVTSLARIHPPPWRVESDWTSEVVDSAGGLVAKFSFGKAADLTVAICGELESLTETDASCDDAP